MIFNVQKLTSEIEALWSNQFWPEEISRSKTAKRVAEEICRILNYNANSTKVERLKKNEALLRDGIQLLEDYAKLYAQTKPLPYRLPSNRHRDLLLAYKQLDILQRDNPDLHRDGSPRKIADDELTTISMQYYYAIFQTVPTTTVCSSRKNEKSNQPPSFFNFSFGIMKVSRSVFDDVFEMLSSDPNYKYSVPKLRAILGPSEGAWQKRVQRLKKPPLQKGIIAGSLQIHANTVQEILKQHFYSPFKNTGMIPSYALKAACIFHDITTRETIH